MKFNFLGNISGLGDGISLLSKDLGFDICEDGIPVKIINRPGNIEISFSNGMGKIFYSEKIHFFRALGLFIQEYRNKDVFSLEEVPQFKTNGVMIDCSRNSVMRVETIKYLIGKMALMGLNLMMLYTEETYEVPEYPYFGYMRGRYTHAELKACDDYANIFGIELIPCIQTLAHLKQALKWNFANDLKDNEDILLAEYEPTYAFIEKLIKAAASPFRSKRIHIGMDEAFQLGLGNYLNKYGYKRRFDIMNNHLNRVRDLAVKQGLKPMIWSDMYFCLGSATHNYYDLDSTIPEDVIEKVPKDMGLVFWDYYHQSEQEYRNYLNKHKSFGCDILFAGGIWTWTGIIVNYFKTFNITNPALAACKKEGITEVFAAMWGDNGAEANIMAALLGFQLYAEHGYASEVAMEKLKRRFEFCTGGDFEAFLDISKVEEVPLSETEGFVAPSNPGKYLLWQDVLIGLFDKHAEGRNLKAHYAKSVESLEKAYAAATADFKPIFYTPLLLAKVLVQKCEIGLELKSAYDRRDIKLLEAMTGKALPELLESVEALRQAHRQQWLATYKPFGWEVLDIRYGGLKARIETALYRINEFLKGHISIIEELEEERLFIDGPNRPADVIYCNFNIYNRIVTASDLG